MRPRAFLVIVNANLVQPYRIPTAPAESVFNSKSLASPPHMMISHIRIVRDSPKIQFH